MFKPVIPSVTSNVNSVLRMLPVIEGPMGESIDFLADAQDIIPVASISDQAGDDADIPAAVDL